MKNIGSPILKTLSLLLIMAMLILSSCLDYDREIYLSEKVPEIDKTREHKALTAFFGLVKLPQLSRLIWRKAPGKSGMLVVFSQEVDPETLDGSDFEITRKDGTKLLAEHASLRPATEEFELRTALLIGDYGIDPENPPITVEIVGDIMTRHGKNYKGQIMDVIPLPDGPILSYAEHFVFDEDYPYKEKGRGCDCPKEETTQVVRMVWSGGVRATNGDELGEPELDAIKVTLVVGSDTITANPYMLADLRDGDNNIDICLKEEGTPVYVQVESNIAIDPNDDENPETGIAVLSRW